MTDDDLRWLRGPDLHVGVAVAGSPRLAVLARPGGPNLLAELDGVEVSGGEGGPVVVLRGGHRLWAAPESPELTYAPDAGPVATEATDGRISVSWGAPPLHKHLTVELDRGGVRISHQLEHRGDGAVSAASWGITQVPLGGRAVLPVGRAPRDPHGLQSSGVLVVWPYSDLDDPRLTLHGGAVELSGRARPSETGAPSGDAGHALKLGADGGEGWIAYARDGELLVVRHRREGRTHAEMGAVAQVYTNRRFVELETLGPLVELAPGSRTGHDVRLQLVATPDDLDVAGITALARAVPGVDG